MDYSMPDLDGIQTVKGIREEINRFYERKGVQI